jgi:hypothetical protein
MLVAEITNDMPREWYTYEGASHIKDLASNVTQVTADGKELAYILNEFRGLPTHKLWIAQDQRIAQDGEADPKFYDCQFVMHWFGDDAKFIAANL